jgi:hypothetical protein
MKTLKSIILAAGLVIFPLALSAADLLKPDTYYPIGSQLRGLIDYTINKLDRGAPLTDAQKTTIRAALEDEAAKLGAIQKQNRGDLTVILRDGLPVICQTSAKILQTLDEKQRKASGIDVVIERREGFQNTVRMSLTAIWERYEAAADLPKLMGVEATQNP